MTEVFLKDLNVRHETSESLKHLGHPRLDLCERAVGYFTQSLKKMFFFLFFQEPTPKERPNGPTRLNRTPTDNA